MQPCEDPPLPDGLLSGLHGAVIDATGPLKPFFEVSCCCCREEIKYEMVLLLGGLEGKTDYIYRNPTHRLCWILCINAISHGY
ncbi:hypothetical protein NPIL_74681 [Nephila pilipes]|uniref:Uncharacterized protein n=1 Tax=Nephila pilipes TaxID=299642 RepID=A0A8X6TLC7_NEPPI|nr:hypothetical protein NPIL_74681 [Nephila pilipes]